jgi:hypothetical protein
MFMTKKCRPISCVFVVLLASLVACGGDEGCINTVRSRLAAPDSKHQAVVFDRACGATTAPSAQVSILSAPDSLPKGVGNVVITRGALETEVRWVNEKQLAVILSPSSRLLTKKTDVDGIAIIYQ